MEVITFADVINNVVSTVGGDAPMVASANFSLAREAGIVGSDGTAAKGAAEFGGFDHFNWYQEIVSITGGSTCRSTGVDPTPGGNCSGLFGGAVQALNSLFPAGGSALTALINTVSGGLIADEAKWYWDETAVPGREGFRVADNTTSSQLKFEDNPGGFPVGTQLEFYTYLAGVMANGTDGAVFASPTFQNTAFKWRYTQTVDQNSPITGLQFFQNGFFDSSSGGVIEFLGYLTEQDWMEATPRLQAQGLDVRGLAAPASVPEPASWAMMLLGFGGIGLAVRRRKPLTQIA